MSISNILTELTAATGTNAKLQFLKNHVNNNTLQNVLQFTYDKTKYNFGISIAALPKLTELEHGNEMSLEYAMDQLHLLINRHKTGHDARDMTIELLTKLSKEDAEIFYNIIDRTQHIQLGRTNINKVWKNLITKQVYAGCYVYTVDTHVVDKTGKQKTIKGTAGNIPFPAYIQLKSDGTYREFEIRNNTSHCVSRSGKSYSYPLIQQELNKWRDGYAIGELTVILNDKIFEIIMPKLKKADAKAGTTQAIDLENEYNKCKRQNVEFTLPRGIANGLLNSDTMPESQIRFTTWDFISHDEYIQAAEKVKGNLPVTKYKERFEQLITLVDDSNVPYIQVTDYEIVNTLKEATDYVSEQLRNGLEGGILKSFDMPFKDGKSKFQLKMKLKFSIEVRIVGFIEGKLGTSREDTFASLMYTTDDERIKGSVSSGISANMLVDMNNDRDSYLGKVIEVSANDITQGRGNIHYALSHPRFEFMRDKNITDTLKSANLTLESAKLFTV